MLVHNRFKTLLHPLSLGDAADSLSCANSQQKEKNLIFNEYETKVRWSVSETFHVLQCTESHGCKFFALKTFKINVSDVFN